MLANLVYTNSYVCSNVDKYKNHILWAVYFPLFKNQFILNCTGTPLHFHIVPAIMVAFITSWGPALIFSLLISARVQCYQPSSVNIYQPTPRYNLEERRPKHVAVIYSCCSKDMHGVFFLSLCTQSLTSFRAVYHLHLKKRTSRTPKERHPEGNYD